MSREVKAGDKIVVTRFEGKDITPQVVEVISVESDVSERGEECGNIFTTGYLDKDGEGIGNQLKMDPKYTHERTGEIIDSWHFADKPHEDVEIGDKIVVTRYFGDSCQREAIVTEVYDSVIDVQFCGSDEEDVLFKNRTDIDEWEYASEDYVQQREEETLQHRQAHAYYDDEALSPTYSDAVRAGMTFAEYTGVNITEESLDFEPKEEEVLRGITAESLNFEEATKSDAVNHPSHYNYGDIEVIDFIEQVTEQYEDGFDAYIVGNALKYLARSPHKNGLEDVKKAVWYLERLIKRKEGE